MLGVIIGDIVGSVHEFNNYRAKDFSPFFHAQASYTDDTVCTVAVADALINARHPGEALKDWGGRYWENGGWGGRFAIWLGSDTLEPYNSFGNGAAMRVAPAGLLARTLEECVELSNWVTAVTHNHPEGMKGAAATASAVHMARSGFSQTAIRKYVADHFG
jgi:ADP-ribosyl-[dinitrogen reductase] hydrolase